MAQQQGVFKAIRIVHLSMLLGLLLFTVISIIVNQRGFVAIADESFDRMAQLIAVIFSATALVLGFKLFKRRLTAARESAEPAEKRMGQYMAACLLWWALIEGPGLLAVIGFLVTGNYAFIGLAVFHILLLLVFMPRKDNIILLLNLNSEEVKRLEGLRQ